MKGFALPVMILAVMIIAGSSLVYVMYVTDVPASVGQDNVKRFTSCSQLSEFLEENSGSGYYGMIGGIARAEDLSMQINAPTAAPEAGESSEKSGWSDDYSATNVQVEGVDEADIVKNDGKYVYVVSKGRIAIVDAYPAEGASVISEINLSGYAYEIFINGDRLVAFTQGYGGYRPMPMVDMEVVKDLPLGRWDYRSSIFVYDISDRSNPLLVRNISLEGDYYDSRMIGDYVYVISRKPTYSYSDPGIPRILEGGAERSVCNCGEVYYFDVPDTSYQFTTVTSFNVKDLADPQSKVFLLGYSQNLYVSADNIYITYQKRTDQKVMMEDMITEVLIPSLPTDVGAEVLSVWNSNMEYYEKMERIGEIIRDYQESLGPEQAASLQQVIEGKMQEYLQGIAKEMDRSSVHRISVSDGMIEYAAGGSVPGTPLNQFSMDEHGGYFRIATTTGGWLGGTRTENLNHVYVLDMNLNIVGKLEDLAERESIYSTRFIGDRLYMVTFERIDPLFVIDLSDPYAPSVLGKLKIPGYSDYLHPYDENHIIGLGMDTEENQWGGVSASGVKLSLFDVTDVSNPVEISKYVIGERGSHSYALNDHKAFLFDRDKELLVIPARIATWNGDSWRNVTYTDGAQVFRLNLDEGFVHRGEITHSTEKNEEDYYYPRYEKSVKRSLYISDVLYTLSESLLKMNSLDDLSELKSIGL